MILALRALAATVVIGVASISMWMTSNSAEGPTLGHVFDQLMDSDGVQLSLTGQDIDGLVLVSNGRMRFDRLADIDGEKMPTSTRLLGETSLWDITWRQNRASAEPKPMLADGDKNAPNIAAVLNWPLDEKAWRQVRETRPKRITTDSGAHLLYECICRCPIGPVHVKAVVDPGTQFLKSLELQVEQHSTLQPLSRLDVVNTDAVFNEDMFIVGDTLTEDGRIGKIMDAQGIITVRPRIASGDPMRPGRNTPVLPGMILMPDDVVTTGARGANALTVRLVPDTSITIGPNSTVRLESPTRIQVLHGELRVVGTKKRPITVATGLNGGETMLVKDTAIFRVGTPTGLDDTTVTKLEKAPRWLEGFDGATNDESIGSLVANVDGRDVPLTVGYHKVTVDIRDQIARTTIEESFVNHTHGRLEGQFYFPLPQDASISGFGMWIGNELVEADIVEKQRAREIYETILREKRDPGLLEWTGGNLFKARVFPIEAHSEKRIKITYTQVLPMENGRYRYSYGLQSEMLKLNPLRQLNIDVTVSSALPLNEVTSPTHPVLVDQSASAAKLSFEAQEYTPQRDFEVVIEPKKSTEPIVLIPHQRGEDGYFLLQMTVPDGASEGARWTREAIDPEGTPMRLMILCDTSGSMDKATRELQSQFVETLLRCLGPEDRFDVAMVDTDCTWIEPLEKGGMNKQIGNVLDTLEARRSLGWTDLDRAFDSAMQRANDVRIAGVPLERDANCHIIYLGDGVQNTVDADPSAAAARLKKAYQDSLDAQVPIRPTFHAVSLGSSYETVVLNALASLNGGSTRHLSAEEGPAKTALQLLREITAPGLKDIDVSFEGIRTARVYPEVLPNLAAGKQQILIGRYLPEGKNQQGKVVVTGVKDGEKVRYTTDVTLADAESGNSFIPRLWARKHLDALLQEGSSQLIQDEIIALSEEFHIITPYTSLLVLESDEDRERFGVKKRFLMRDGERFFADGRDNANYELLQKYVQEAGAYRMGLRRQILMQLSGMGRTTYQQMPGIVSQWAREELRRDNVVHSINGTWGFDGDEMMLYDAGGFAGYGRGYDGRMSGGRAYAASGPMSAAAPMDGLTLELAAPSVFSADLDIPFTQNAFGLAAPRFADYEGAERKQKELLAFAGERYEPMPSLALEPMAEMEGSIAYNMPASLPVRELSKKLSDDYLSAGLGFGESNARFRRGARASSSYALGRPVYPNGAKDRSYYMFAYSDLKSDKAEKPSQHVGLPYWVESLFPGLPGVPSPQAVIESEWTDEARRLVESLLRKDALLSKNGGWKITSHNETFDPRWDVQSGETDSMMLVSKNAWLHKQWYETSATSVSWCDGKRRGVYTRDMMLGRSRPSADGDLEQAPFILPNELTTSLERSYATYGVKIDRPEKGTGVITFTHPNAANVVVRYTIDTRRNVLLEQANITDGKTTYRKAYSEFVEVGGHWFPGEMEQFDADGKLTSHVTYSYEQVAQKPFDEAIAAELADKAEIVSLDEPRPTLTEAKQAKADGKGTFADHFLLMAHFAATQQNDRVLEEWEAAKRHIADKRGAWWIENMVLQNTRGHEQFKQRSLERIGEWLDTLDPATVTGDEYARIDRLRGMLPVSNEERIDVLERVKPFAMARSPHTKADYNWRQQYVQCFQNAGQYETWLSMGRAFAEDFPREYYAQTTYMQAMVHHGRIEESIAFIEATCVPERKWREHEKNNMREQLISALENKRRYSELVSLMERWNLVEESTDSYLLDRYLTALILGGQDEKAWRLMHEWLAAVTTEEGALPATTSARFEAAYRHAVGQGRNRYTNDFDSRFKQDMVKAALALLKNEKAYSRGWNIAANHRFSQEDEYDLVCEKVLKWLKRDMGTLRADHLMTYVNCLTRRGDKYFDSALRRKTTDTVRERWEQARAIERGEKKMPLKADGTPLVVGIDVDNAGQLENVLFQLLSHGDHADERLELRRYLLETALEEEKNNRASQLFHELLSRSWNEDTEEELFALLPRLHEVLAEGETSVARTAEQLTSLMQLNNWCVERHLNQLNAAIEKPEDLTRTELAERQKENREAVLALLVKRLRGEIKRQDDALHPWLDIERVYYAAQLPDADINALADACWERLGRAPIKVEEDETGQFMLDAALNNRLLQTLMCLSVRRGADPSVGDEVLAFIEEAIALSNGSPLWKQTKYSMLVALDRPEALEKDLREWSKSADRPNPWRVPLAYLLAEQNELKEAIALLEEVEADDELAPTDYRALSNWYLAFNRRDDYERAKMDMYLTMDENSLSNLLGQYRNRYERRGDDVPEEFDPEALLVLHALLKKSPNPSNYMWQIRQLYESVRDFRILLSLSDAVVGHTSGSVYNTLQNMSQVTDKIQEEATVDEILKHIETVREGKTLASDLRALDLLEVIVERKAAELPNAPGPHGDRATAAIKRAFEREWADHERRLMAQFLYSMGRINYEPLGSEQLRQMKALYLMEEPGTTDRLDIGHSWARLLGNYYGRQETAIELLESVLAEYMAAHDGRLTSEADGPFNTYLDLLRSVGHYAKAERVTLEQLANAPGIEREYRLRAQLYDTYRQAFANSGSVSFGTADSDAGRAAFYRELLTRINKELDTKDANYQRNLFDDIQDIYRTANRFKLDYQKDLRAYAFLRMPAVIGIQADNMHSIYSNTAHLLRDLLGPADALELLVTAIEDEPEWFRVGNDYRRGWRQHHYRLGEYHQQAGGRRNAAVEERLLALVTSVLREDMLEQRSIGRTLYDNGNSYFWSAKADLFAEIAQECFEKQKDSERSILHISSYVYHGLDRYDQAIDMLLDGYRRDVLEERGKSQLVDYLHERNRYGESIPVLLELVELRPDNIGYRVELIRAYFKTNQVEAMREAWEEADAYFHDGGRWHENVIYQLALICNEIGMHEQAAEYLDELIPMHQRTQPNRGIGNGTLSNYYTLLANVRAGLNQTDLAVEAACGAVVSWGSNIDNRRNAIETLKSVLKRSPDLEAYIKQYEADVDETNLDNPIVRKALGMVLADQGKNEEAIRQLKLSAELQPNDPQVYQVMLQCHDRMRDPAGAIETLFASIAVSRREISLYRTLGQRFEELKAPSQAERAYTSIVEALPNESESHTMLAEIREQQQRTDDAVAHWEQVAAIRKLEPTGLQRLFESQLRTQRFDDAEATLERLASKAWPERFGDMKNQVRHLEERLLHERARFDQMR